MKRRSLLVYGVLVVVLALTGVWQMEEHVRFQEYARTSLMNRSKDIAEFIGSFLQGLQIQRAVFRDRLQPLLDRMVGVMSRSDEAAPVLAVELLNPEGVLLARAGTLVDLSQTEIVRENERWGRHSLTMVYPVVGATNVVGAPENQLVLVDTTNVLRRPFRGGDPRDFGRRHDPMDGPPRLDDATNAPPPAPREDRPPPGEDPPHRPFWARRWSEAEYLENTRKCELHGLVLALSTERFQAACARDFWFRCLVMLVASASVAGWAFAWRNLAMTSELQIRLVRASELNSHLKEMNLAAAGLAHETRNPLNIIRGLAQMISKQPAAVSEIQAKSREIINEADKVAAQLNEFINYSRPREVRRSRVALTSVITEVARALTYDVQEKKLVLRIEGDVLTIEADEQLLRQALFNLLLNAVQAAEPGGEIRVLTQRHGAAEAVVDIRDDGPGVPAEQREEIFKPYFTTHQKGTGLGLAVVQQIVLAHGWEITCLANEPKGAIFRISHLKLAA